MHRVVKGLLEAHPCLKPRGIPQNRPRGAKAMGLRFERAVAKALPDAAHGQWFDFQDSNGPGYCQPDLFFVFPDCVVVLECKYTWVPAAQGQIFDLYAPVLGKVFGRPVGGIVVCKNLTGATPLDLVVDDYFQAIRDAHAFPSPPYPVLHWLGKVPLR